MKHASRLDFCSLKYVISYKHNNSSQVLFLWYTKLFLIASRFCIKCMSVDLKVFASELRAPSIHSDLKVSWFFMSVARTWGWEETCCCVKLQKDTQVISIPEIWFQFMMLDLLVKIRPCGFPHNAFFFSCLLDFLLLLLLFVRFGVLIFKTIKYLCF